MSEFEPWRGREASMRGSFTCRARISSLCDVPVCGHLHDCSCINSFLRFRHKVVRESAWFSSSCFLFRCVECESRERAGKLTRCLLLGNGTSGRDDVHSERVVSPRGGSWKLGIQHGAARGARKMQKDKQTEGDQAMYDGRMERRDLDDLW